MKRNGFVLIHRQGITQCEWKHPLRTLAWIDLITLAAWENYKTDDGTKLKRGELIASERFLARRWGQNCGTVHRWLLYWENQKQVQRVVQASSKQVPQRLFVVNYARFQDIPQAVPKRLPKRLPKQMKRKEEKEEIENNTMSAEADVSNEQKLHNELFDWFGEKSKREVRSRHDKRVSSLRSILKLFTKEEIMRSWAMMMDDTFLRGANPSQKDYCDIDYALRIDKVEKFYQLYTQKYGTA